MKLAIIPARGGSKRIPRKNIRSFCGKPIIAYSIEAAQQSGLFEHVIVSTDDPEIAQVARDCGAEVPFPRPAELADDHATIHQVMLGVLQQWEDAGMARPEIIACLYATAPMMQAQDLVRGFQALGDDINSSMAVTSFPYPIQRALQMDGRGLLSMIQPQYATTRSQDLPEAVHEAAQYIFWTRAALRGEEPERRAGVMIPRHSVQDIDTPEDWWTLEWLYRKLHERPGPTR